MHTPLLTEIEGRLILGFTHTNQTLGEATPKDLNIKPHPEEEHRSLSKQYDREMHKFYVITKNAMWDTLMKVRGM